MEVVRGGMELYARNSQYVDIGMTKPVRSINLTLNNFFFQILILS